jgi:tellurite resistance protein TerC
VPDVSLGVGLWVGFHLLVVTMLVVDLGVSRRRARALHTGDAVVWSLVWAGISVAIGGGIAALFGVTRGMEFFTGYVIEYALSIDNLFVFLLIFGAFHVRPELQHRLLFWGILGEFAMRAPLLIAGTQVVTRFHWLLYAFGAFLVYSAVKTSLANDGAPREDENGVVRFARRVLPVSRPVDGIHFFVREEGRLKVTPLFLVLLVLNVTDLMFAFDSIPAVLGVTRDPFVAYTSNVCAIFGLRSLFSVVASLMGRVRFLKTAVAVILGFVGLKMIGAYWFDLPIGVSLGFIALCLAVAGLASRVWPAPAQ